MQRIGALWIVVIAAAGCRSVPAPEVASPAVYDDTPWRAVLAGAVRDGLVDYAAIQKHHRDDLARYVDMIGRCGPRSTPEQFPEPADRLAFHLNAYNAIMVQRWIDARAGQAAALADAAPQTGAGADTADGTGIGTYAAEKATGANDPEGRARRTRQVMVDAPDVNLLWFVVDHWRVDGKWMSLNTLEKTYILPRHDEPRVHFALVCGAISCPPLRAEPYETARLDAQLEDQGRQWLRYNDDAFVLHADGRVQLSLIFMWSFEEFREEGKMPGVLRRYLAPDDPRLEPAIAAIESGNATWLPYFWTINDARLHGLPVDDGHGVTMGYGQ